MDMDACIQALRATLGLDCGAEGAALKLPRWV
jgi:hypothetical protein